MIKYRINYEKAIETIVWLANKRPGIDIYHIAKVLYYADKLHVNRYARPVLGDTYTCMQFGPVPSGVRDLITSNSWLNPEHLASVEESFTVGQDRFSSINAKRKPEMKYFSKTDQECLQEAFDNCIDKSFEELVEITHNEKCWIETDTNQPIDYSLLIDDDNPHKDEILKEMSETSIYVQV